MKLGAARMIRRFGFRKLLVVNGLLASASISIMPARWVGCDTSRPHSAAYAATAPG